MLKQGAAAALVLRREGAWAQNRGMWVSQMIRIATPLHLRDRLHHLAKHDAIPQIKQPLAGFFGRIPLGRDAGDDPTA